MAGSRDEWASAALHNANTKCNVIVPVWSKKVKDSDMEQSFQRLAVMDFQLLLARRKRTMKNKIVEKKNHFL